MAIYQLEILNPNAKSLLEELEKLGLIKVTQTDSTTKTKSSTPAKDFVNKWKGFLNEEDIKDAKWEYLSKKYL
jgi:hypothetical protein